MKKQFLILALALVCFPILKAQQTMRVHGTNLTRFYLYENQQLYKIMADDLWFNSGSGNGSGGITYATNLVLIPVTNFDIEVRPVQKYISCYEAKLTSSGECGPLEYQSYYRADGIRISTYFCVNRNDNGCLITNSKGEARISPDGNF
jgi:hypothetical protein